MSTLTAPPSVIVQGTTVEWEQDFPDYDTADGWSIDYYFTKADVTHTVNGLGVGTLWMFTLASTQTATWADGSYVYQAYATGPGRRDFVAGGRTAVELDFSRFPGGVDTRSSNEKILQALRAALESRASRTELSYSIEGVSIASMTHAELTSAVATFKWRVAMEKNPALRTGQSIGITMSGRR